MSLRPGVRFGPNEVQSLLGAGGMGEVYGATDTRLDGTVAIKVLPAHVSADPERRARLTREAKTIAALNHPRFCTLRDVGGTADLPAVSSSRSPRVLPPPGPSGPVPHPVRRHRTPPR